MLKSLEIGPFYQQAELVNAPLAKFDFLLYDKEKPVVLSAKVSLRERWKQAEFEAQQLRRLYHRAGAYLLIASEEHVSVNKKIVSEGLRGLDECINVFTPRFDELLFELRSRDFCKTEPIHPLKTGKFCLDLH